MLRSSWVNQALQVVFGRYRFVILFQNVRWFYVVVDQLKLLEIDSRMFFVVLGCFMLVQVVHVAFRVVLGGFSWF